MPELDLDAIDRRIAMLDMTRRLIAEVRRLRSQVTKAERAEELAIEDRDRYHEWADRMAYAIAPREVIGEHTTGNNPWRGAIEEAGRLRAQVAELQAELVAARNDAATHERWTGLNARAAFSYQRRADRAEARVRAVQDVAAELERIAADKSGINAAMTSERAVLGHAAARIREAINATPGEAPPSGGARLAPRRLCGGNTRIRGHVFVCTYNAGHDGPHEHEDYPPADNWPPASVTTPGAGHDG
ncbi:hypothetical protein [Parafrankia discariae]|uniref:hypothetical protein n=1 Tax=Parafrankia discariae TaxID=365528 RepID=UPI000366DCCB|nr:hypothetical protein [Parafrankia discariae]